MSERGTAERAVTSAELKAAARRALAVLGDAPARAETALSATWPEPVLALPEGERVRRVRRGADTVLLDEIDPETGARRGARGFVRAVLRVPLDHPEGQIYGVFVEVNRQAYQALRRAYDEKESVEVWGTLATRLPLLEAAYASEVLVREDGSDRRPRIVEVRHRLLADGPAIGP